MIEDRHRDLGRAGVVGADVDHDVGILRGADRRSRFRARGPMAGGGRRVVPVGVFDLKVADAVIDLLKRHA